MCCIPVSIKLTAMKKKKKKNNQGLPSVAFVHPSLVYTIQTSCRDSCFMYSNRLLDRLGAIGW